MVIALNIPPSGPVAALPPRWRSWFAKLFAAIGSAAPAAATLSREREFAALVDRYTDTINGICYSFAGKEAEFDDLRQDALINLWRGLEGFRGNSDLRTWVYRVTLNSCVSVYRRGAFARSSVPLEAVADIPDTSAEEMDRTRWVRALIGRLDPADRAIILMWLDDLQYDEIAEVMGMNRNTVASRLRRIRLKLSKMIENE